jgi:hypothetical protein
MYLFSKEIASLSRKGIVGHYQEWKNNVSYSYVIISTKINVEKQKQ